MPKRKEKAINKAPERPYRVKARSFAAAGMKKGGNRLQKEAEKQPPVSIVKATPEQLASPVRAELTRGLQYLAAALSKPMEPDVLIEMHETILDFEKSLESFEKPMRERILHLTLSEGKKVTDKGTYELRIGPFVQRVQPSRTGTDPKKFEALLRAKGLNPGDHMTQEVVLKLGPGQAESTLATGVLTQEELDSCKYDMSYTVKRAEVKGPDTSLPVFKEEQPEITAIDPNGGVA